MLLNLSFLEEHPNLYIFFRCFLKFIKSKTMYSSYIFGSATWRLAIYRFNIKKNDIDFVFNKAFMKDILDYINTFLQSEEMIYSLTENTSINTLYTDDSKNKTHYILYIENLLKLDLIFVRDTRNFINNLCDFDINMLVYSIKDNCYIVGGFNWLFKSTQNNKNPKLNALSIDLLLSNAKKNIITFEYIIRNNRHFVAINKSTYSRLIKLLNDGFSVNINKYFNEVLELLSDSFNIGNNYNGLIETKQKCNSLKYRDCSCNRHDKNFVNFCTNIKGYQLAKDAYLKIVQNAHRSKKKPSNYYTNFMVQYGLLNNDFDYVFKLIKKYFLCKRGYYFYVALVNIPFILRKIGNIELTIKFIDAINKKFSSLIETGKLPNFYHICSLSCDNIYQCFAIDSLLSFDYNYYAKLYTYIPKFESYTNYFDAQSVVIYARLKYEIYLVSKLGFNDNIIDIIFSYIYGINKITSICKDHIIKMYND